MAITLKDDALRGDRVQMLANLAGYSKYEALGRLSYLWDHCVSRETELLDERRVQAFLGVPLAVLIDCDLAERDGDGARVRGVREEVASRRRRTEQARRAGQASAQLRASPQSPQLPVDPESTPSQPEVNSEFPRAKSDLISDSGSGDLFSSGASASSETSGDLRQQEAGQKRKRATRLPADFAPNDGHREFCRSNHLNLNAEFAQFTDHHTAKGTTFLDWNAALRTWLRNAVKFSGGRGRALTGSTAARQLLEEMEARDRGESR